MGDKMIGETFFNYRIVSRLGSGAMGTVFLGEHERIARRAAIKILAPEFAENAELLQRFFNEARATSLIHHPAIVEVLDCGVHPDGRPYIVMEYLSGETLAERLTRTGAVAWPVACATAHQLAEALGAAHRHGIVHRDVKPENVMLVGTPPTVVKLLDFGVAKLLHDTPWVARTVPGKLIGTPRYMAPEQYAGEAVDARVDVYALGCVLFEMVCGQAPFLGERLGELINAHRWRPPPPASSLVPIPAALDRLIAQMLAKRREDRPADMAIVAGALRELLGGGGDETVIAKAPPVPAVAAAGALRELLGGGGDETVIAKAPPVPAVAASSPPVPHAARRSRLMTTAVLAVAAAAGAAAYLAHPSGPARPLPPVPITAHAQLAPTAGSHRSSASQQASPLEPMSVPVPVESAPAVTPAPPATPTPASGRRLPTSRHGRPGAPAKIDADGIVEL